jgi:hypothetical protein
MGWYLDGHHVSSCAQCPGVLQRKPYIQVELRATAYMHYESDLMSGHGS